MILRSSFELGGIRYLSGMFYGAMGKMPGSVMVKIWFIDSFLVTLIVR